MMKRVWTLVVLVLFLAVAGCGMEMPGFRFAPTEGQKQQAQVGADLSGVAAHSGLPPGTAATRQMAAAARNSAVYIGAPGEPVPIEDLIPPGVRDAWTTLQEKVVRVKLKESIQAAASQAAAGRMGEILDDIATQGSVAVDVVIHRLRAVVEGLQMARTISHTIAVPGDPQMSAAEQARLDAMDAALTKINAAAAANAARRPTVTEIAEKGESMLANLLEDWWPLLVGIPGVGGVAAVIRARRKRRLDAEAVATAAAPAKDG